MKWKVEDDHLPCTVLHTSVYRKNNETIIGECSFTIGEIYIYQPLTTWLNLHNSDEVGKNEKVMTSSFVLIGMLVSWRNKYFSLLSSDS